MYGSNFHEDLTRSEAVRASSDRNLGLVFAGFLMVVGLWPVRLGGQVRIPAIAGAGLLLVVAICLPGTLRPVNRIWTAFGLLLGRFVNPIVTAILFFCVFAPVGLVRRLMGKDPLRLKPAADADTYWIARQPPGPRPESMSKQF